MYETPKQRVEHILRVALVNYARACEDYGRATAELGHANEAVNDLKRAAAPSTPSEREHLATQQDNARGIQDLRRNEAAFAVRERDIREARLDAIHSVLVSVGFTDG